MRKLFFRMLAYLMLLTLYVPLHAQDSNLSNSLLTPRISTDENAVPAVSLRNDPMVIGPDLYNQMGAISDYTLVNVEYTFTDFDEYTSFAAEDFEVPESQSMEIAFVRTTVYTPFSLDMINSFNVIVYSDANGTPGTEFKVVENNTNSYFEPYVSNSYIYDMTLKLAENITLPAGKYWICIQAVSDVSEENAYNQPGFWITHVLQSSGDAIGYQAHFKNPGGGYQSIYTWKDMTTFWKTAAGFDRGLYNFNFALFGPAKTNDLAVTDITAPTSGAELSDAEEITVTIQNHGTALQADGSYQVRCRVNGGAWTDAEEGLEVASGNEISYTFHEVLDLSAKDVYNIDVEVVSASDENLANNSYSVQVENFGVIYPAVPNAKVVYTTCEGTFTDHGGLGDVTVSYSDDTVVFVPGSANSRIRLEFYNTGMSGAYCFHFYNGSSTDAPELGDLETFNGNTGVFPQEVHGMVIEGVNPEGALTIIIPGFDTGSSSNNVMAKVSCVPNVEHDFRVVDVNFSKPYSWETETIQLSARVHNRGSLESTPMVTFFANDLELGSVTSTVLKYGETGKASFVWTPAEAGNYTITAKVPADQGAYATDKEFSKDHEIYPLGYLVEGFEGEMFPPEGWVSKKPGATSRILEWYNERPYIEGKYTLSCGADTLITPKLNILATDTLRFIYGAGFFGMTCNIVYAPTLNGPWKNAHTVSYGAPNVSEYNAPLKKAAGANYIGFAISGGGGSIDFIRGVERFFNDNDLAITSFVGKTDPQVGISNNYSLTIRNLGKGTLNGSDYTVKLWKEVDGVATLLNTINGTEVAFANYQTFDIPVTFTTPEKGVVYATVDYTNDQDVLNNTSEKLDLTVIKAGFEYVFEGNDDITLDDYYTWSGYYANYSEVIYHKDSLGVKGEINALSLFYNFGWDYNLPIQIYIAETNNNELNSGFLSTKDMVKVFDGTVSVEFTNDQYKQLYIPFDISYLYSGNKNLVVAFYRPTTGDFASSINLLATTRGANVQRSHGMQAYEVETDISDQAALNKLPSQVHSYVPNAVFYVKTSGMDATLAGTVTDEHDNLFEGVKVMLDGYANYTITSSDGKYQFPVMPVGTTDITAEKYGYYNQTKNGTFTSANETVVNFKMEPLATVAVTGTVIANDSLRPVAGVEVFLTGYVEGYTVTDIDGNFVIDGVYGDKTYTVTFEHPKYVAQSTEIIVPYEGYDMDTITLDEVEAPVFNVIATISETNQVNVIWQAPYSGTEVLFDPTLGGTFDNYWYNDVDENVQMGNLFKVSNPGTVTSIEFSNWAWSGANSGELYFRFYDKNQQEIMKPVAFTMPNENVDWMQVDVPDFTYNEDFYVMIHWNKIHQQTSAIVYSYTDNNNAYLVDANGKWYLLTDYVNEFYNLNVDPHTLSIRANVLENGSKATKALVSYDIYRNDLAGSAIGTDWTKLNTEPVTGGSVETSFTDAGFTDLTAGFYIYKVQALYTKAASEFTLSNSVNKGLFVNVTINVTANNGQNIDGSKVVLANDNGTAINTYMADVAGGKVIFNGVLKGNYELTVTNGAAYDQYISNVTISNDTVLNVELLETIIPPSKLNVVVDTLNDEAVLTWGVGFDKQYKLDDDSFETGLSVTLGNTAEIGNFFDVNEGGQIFSAEIFSIANGGTGGKVALYFYNEAQELIGQTEKFVMVPSDNFQQIPVGNLAYSGPIYAMVHWFEDETLETDVLAADIDGGNAGAMYHDSEGWDGLNYNGSPTCFGLRLNVLVSSKKVAVIENKVNGTVTTEIGSVADVKVIKGMNQAVAPKSAKSFNIYLDNTLVASGITSQSFTFTETEHLKVPGVHIYQAEVEAVYVSGNSIKTPVSFTYDYVVGILDAIDANLNIYPNPASSEVTFTNAMNSKVEFYDALGKLVKTTEVVNQNNRVSLTDLLNGAYTIKIIVPQGTLYRNLVITK